MKYFVLFIVFGTIIIKQSEPKIIKEYAGGRNGYWRHSLTLFDNSGYLYTEWIHIGYSLKDTGNFELKNGKLILNSIETVVKQRNLGSKKREKRFERRHQNYKHFENESFQVDNNKIYLTEPKESEDSIQFQMNTLYELQNKE